MGGSGRTRHLMMDSKTSESIRERQEDHRGAEGGGAETNGIDRIWLKGSVLS